jgi:hypothetical protein
MKIVNKRGQELAASKSNKFQREKKLKNNLKIKPN